MLPTTVDLIFKQRTNIVLPRYVHQLPYYLVEKDAKWRGREG